MLGWQGLVRPVAVDVVEDIVAPTVMASAVLAMPAREVRVVVMLEVEAAAGKEEAVVMAAARAAMAMSEAAHHQHSNEPHNVPDANRSHSARCLDSHHALPAYPNDSLCGQCIYRCSKQRGRLRRSQFPWQREAQTACTNEGHA